MIHLTPPEDFNPKFEASGCLVECEGKILFLLRDAAKPEGAKWGAPAGKVEMDEVPIQAALRELFEETGHTATEEELALSHVEYVRYDEYDFVYHVYHLTLPKRIDVVLEAGAHTDSCWVTPEESLRMSLVRDADSTVKRHYALL